MTVSHHARFGNDALSEQAKRGVTPVEKPERRKKGAKGLARTQMERKPSKLKRGPVGHASPEQKAKVEREHARILCLETAAAGTEYAGVPLDPAHVVPRALGGCDHEDCIVPLSRFQHERYDRGELDLLPHLTLDEQAHAVKHLGILGALKRTTGENYVPETLAGGS